MLWPDLEETFSKEQIRGAKWLVIGLLAAPAVYSLVSGTLTGYEEVSISPLTNLVILCLPALIYGLLARTKRAILVLGGALILEAALVWAYYFVELDPLNFYVGVILLFGSMVEAFTAMIGVFIYRRDPPGAGGGIRNDRG
jgi:hypothetical protein